MIIAKFCSDGQYYKTIYGLAQWDYGQVLQVYGLNLPEMTDIHMVEEFGDMSFTILGHRNEDGSTSASIPDILLQSGKNIVAYIYVCDDGQGETLRTILMPVKKRARPENYDGSSLTPMQEILNELHCRADDLNIQEDILQLMSEGQPIGTRIRLPVQEREIELKMMVLISNGVIQTAMSGTGWWPWRISEGRQERPRNLKSEMDIYMHYIKSKGEMRYGKRN